MSKKNENRSTLHVDQLYKLEQPTEENTEPTNNLNITDIEDMSTQPRPNPRGLLLPER